MSKFVGVNKVPKKNLPPGYHCYQLDFQYQGNRHYKHVVTKNASEANDIRHEWIKDTKKKKSSVPVADADYSTIWRELEIFYGNGKTRDALREELMQSVSDPQEVDKVSSIRKIIKKISSYHKVFNRMFIIDREGKPDSGKDVNENFFNEYKIYHCFTMGRLKGWGAEQIKSKTILNQMCQRKFIPKDKFEGMKGSDSWKKTTHKQKDFPLIPDEELKTLFDEIKKDRPDFYRVYVAMLRTGRRVEEVTLTRRTSITFKQGKLCKLFLRAFDAKMDRSSYIDTVDVEFDNLLWEAYQDSCKHKSLYLFLNRCNRKCNQRRLCEYLSAKSKEIVGVKITNHYFRHRFLTECGINRIPWAEVSKISGLKDMKIYMKHYDHSTPEGQKKVFALTRGIV